MEPTETVMETVTGDAAAVARCSSLLLGFRTDMRRGAVIVDNVATQHPARGPFKPHI